MENQKSFIILVSVKTKAKENKVIHLGALSYQVFLAALPTKGKANALLIAVLADYFDVPKIDVTIVAGFTGKLKRVSVICPPAK
jgi:uncharacterized protein YggU (UPF0235/DUF167 family)